MDDLIGDVKRTEAQTLKTYRELESNLLDSLSRVRAVLRALGDQSHTKEGIPGPIIDDVRAYLRDRSEPVHASEIIRAVGDRRKKRFPQLLRPYGDVWKSLQFHDRHDREIVCVERTASGKLRRGKLKQRAKRRSNGNKRDSAEFYNEQNNLFWFRDEIGSSSKPN